MKPANRRRRRDPNARHATAKLLLDAAVELLETVPVNELSLAMVLERCGVSHGSVYYHFEDFTNLVEEAIVMRFESGLKESLVGIEALLNCRDAAEFRQHIEELAVRLGSPERRSFRLSRVEVLAATRNRPDFASKIAQSQQSVIDQQGELYAEFQRRGWLRSDLDPMVMSAVMVSIFLGRVVDDLSARPVPADDWNAVWMQAIRAILFST